MEWFVFVLVNIIASSIVAIGINLLTKKFKVGSTRLMFHTAFFAFLICIPIFLYEMSMNPGLNTEIVPVLLLFGSGILGAVGLLFFAKAYKAGELSTVGPLENFRPVFAALFSVLILKEILTVNVIVAIFFVLVGGFIVHSKNDIRKTVEGILHSKASLYMLACASVYGLVSVINRLALGYYSPLKLYFFIIFLNALFYYVSLRMKDEKIDFSKKFVKYTAIISVSFVFAGTAILHALSLQSPMYVVPVQMSRTLVVSLFGSLLLKEKGIARKLAGALIMLAGVLLLVL
jgi:drug/metabolite transporter (DMT)-like permease